ncbi:hypothetical protein AZ46_0221500 [Metabacillus indicus LMG 22858]|uniref:Uncharacterized protein n=1 Tax=Metabacillus indicus TaxID=246786 RepID=A0A084GJ29_METID|nr:hypothetical protein AZ46_0221500 [Metabacillus indicus LMG 22858]KEZ47341.1 hypothetical protein GS18_0221165 [Metabacillus indicus]
MPEASSLRLLDLQRPLHPLRKAEAPVLLRQSDKKSPEKSGFDFLGDFVLTEELGAAAGQGVKCLPLQSTGVLS